MSRNLYLIGTTMLLVFLIIDSSSALAQQLDVLPTKTIHEDQSKYTIRFHTGATGSLMAGEWAKEQKSIILNSDSTYLSYGQFNPAFSIYFGGTVDYSLNQDINIVAGLTVLQRRFKQNSQYNYYHPTAQFDEELSNKITYHATYLKIPLRVKLNSLNRIKPFIGIGTNFLLSSKAQVQTIKATIINTELDQEHSGVIRDATLDQKDNTNKFLFSLEAGIEIPVSNRWNITLLVERTNRIFGEINAHVWTGTFGLAYQLNY